MVTIPVWLLMVLILLSLMFLFIVFLVVCIKRIEPNFLNDHFREG